MECLDIKLKVKEVSNYVNKQSGEVDVVPKHIDIVDEANGKNYSVSWGFMLGSFKKEDNSLLYEVEDLKISSAFKKDGDQYTEVSVSKSEEKEIFDKIKNKEAELVCSICSPFYVDKVLVPEDIVESQVDFITVTPVKYKFVTPEYQINYQAEQQDKDDDFDR